jgi:hypothetical protein
MKLTVFSRKIDVSWTQFLFYTGIFILLTLVPVPALFYLHWQGGMDAFYNAMGAISQIIIVVGAPLTALLLIKLAPRIKLKTDVNFCRAMAVSEFVLFAGISLIASVLLFAMADSESTINLGYFGAVSLGIGQIASIMGAAVSSALLYLWLLFFIKPKKDLGRFVEYALVFAVIAVLLGQYIAFTMQYHLLDVPHRISFNLELLLEFARFVFFGFILLHSMPKKLDEAANAFALLYVLPTAILGLESIAGSGRVLWLFSFIDEITILVVLYLLSKSMMGEKGKR